MKKKKNIQINGTYEDCNYVEDDSRRQNKMQIILKGKLRPIYVSFFFFFTTYFPNLSYVNSKRPRKEGCSNDWEKESKAESRRQEKKEGPTRDGEDGRRERTANGRERKRNKAISCEFLV